VKARTLAAEPQARGSAQGAVGLGRHAAPGPRRRFRHRAQSDAFRAHRTRLDELAAGLAALPGQCGAVLGLGDSLCVDALSRPDAFASLWPKLRDGYLLDVVDRLDRRPTRPERVLGFLDEVAEAEVVRRPDAGLGVDVLLRGPGVVGSALELDEELLQISAFTVAPDPVERRIARPSRRAE
jgi:hypothetical protein